MLLSHQNWTLRDHQPKVRNDYGDATRQKNQVIAHHRTNGFLFSSLKQLTVAVNPRQVISGVL